jgi:iron complex transport system permease protein
MKYTLTQQFKISLALFALLLCFVANICTGSSGISFLAVIEYASGNASEDLNFILGSIRIPKAITALFIGMSLSAAGLVMQTLFRNRLAGPYVLGLSSGSSLAVAFLIMGRTFLNSNLLVYVQQPFAIAVASIIGSLTVLSVVLLIARRIADSATVLVAGIMISSFAGAITGVLSYFTSAENLQRYTFWSMGSLANLTPAELWILVLTSFIGLLLFVLKLGALDSLLLGDQYAQSMGVSLEKSRVYLILVTALLVGISTAFCGPIAFVGLAVPHLTRQLYGVNTHHKLYPLTLATGGTIMLLADLLCKLPIEGWNLPINGVTSIIGAPVVLYLILKNRQV